MDELIDSQKKEKQPWQEPAIVLERPLQVRAQEGDPGIAPRRTPRVREGLIGPLGTSGPTGLC